MAIRVGPRTDKSLSAQTVEKLGKTRTGAGRARSTAAFVPTRANAGGGIQPRPDMVDRIGQTKGIVRVNAAFAVFRAPSVI
jgi:hypothetical protein